MMQCDCMHKLKYQLYKLAGIVLGLHLVIACTIQPARIPSGAIPVAASPSVLENEHADEVISDLSEDHVLDDSSLHYYELLDIITRLAVAAGGNPDDWQVYLFDAPDIVDVRAIQGNTIFVWSGIFDVVDSHDEFAGLLACEIAHGLARHTDPVEFNLGSELLFGVTDITASIGVMLLTQGVVAVSGVGMTRWLYVEAADLDELDRAYDEQQIEEMAEIALLILASSDYAPGGLLDFWRRVGSDPGLGTRLQRLSRDLSPGERVAVLEAAMTVLQAGRGEIVALRSQ
jgi:predicted Zn-dependent protease